MTTLDDIINQSFQDEQDRYNRKRIKTGESNNVAKLFSESQMIKTDCNICYENGANCIQCYQCDFKYCQECLSKVISEFNKCSACSANFKDNYSQLKDKNKKKQKPVNTISRSKSSTSTTSANVNTSTGANSNANSNAYGDLLLSDYEIEQLTMIMQMENITLESNGTSRPAKTARTSRKTDNASANTASSSIFNRYLDNDFDDEIESCQFQTIKPNSRYTFRVEQNKDSNELIYLANDNNLCPIILNYKLLDKCFQRSVFICLVELIDKPEIFSNVWQTISSMIYNFTCNYSHLAHAMNFKNQAFLYQKQDLINTINQMVAY